MFENDIFETWLDQKSQELVTKIGNQEKYNTPEKRTDIKFEYNSF